MVTCNHFIYTSAKTEKREGYQVVAKTEGISDEIVDNLKDYLYPIGVNLDDFKESRSLRVLNRNKIAYSIITNIGIGYDARKGTLYNHTFVIDKYDFQKLDNDTRIIDKHFLMDTSLRGKIDKINIERVKLPILFDAISLERPILRKILRFLFLNRKVAILNNFQIKLIPNLLATLPPSMRTIPFSTNVPQPDKQTEYEIIQLPKNLLFKLDRTWKSIQTDEIREITSRKKNVLDEDLEYFVDFIAQRNDDALKKIHSSFEAIQGNDYANKIRFLIHKNLLNSTKDSAKKAEEAYICATTAQHFDPNLASEFLTKAKTYSIEIKNKELLSKISAGELVLRVQNEPLTLKLMETVLEKVNASNEDIRNVILNKIIKKKKSDFREKGFQLIEDVFSSRSYYKDDILRLFIENKFLNSFIISFLIENQTTKKHDIFRLIPLLTKIALSYNFSFLEKLFRIIEINLDDKHTLNEIKHLVYDLHSSRNIKKNTLTSSLNLCKILRSNIEKSLNKKIVKDSERKFRWNSDKYFGDIKFILLDILENMSTLLKSLKDKKKKLSSSEKLWLRDEINSIQSTKKMIESIIYEEPVIETSTPDWYDLFLRFWGLKK